MLSDQLDLGFGRLAQKAAPMSIKDGAMMQPCARKYTWMRDGSFEMVHLVIIKACGLNNPSRRRCLHSFGSWNFSAFANLLHIWCQDQHKYSQIIVPCPWSYHILLHLFAQQRNRKLPASQGPIFDLFTDKVSFKSSSGYGNNWCCAMPLERWRHWCSHITAHRWSI